MLSPHLVRQVELRADKLASDLAERLQHDPHTPSYQRLDRHTLSRHLLAVYQNLGSWLAGRTEAEVDAYFGPIGAERFHEQIPVAEMVYAVILAKRELRGHTQQVSSLASAVEIHAEMEIDAMVGKFFDRVLHAMVRGHDAARERHAKGAERSPGPELGELKPTHMGWVP